MLQCKITLGKTKEMDDGNKRSDCKRKDRAWN